MSALAQFLPWQTDAARRWLSQRGRFAHAWLIHGTPGIGKQQFALAAAASLLCQAPDCGLACGQCQSCQWIEKGNHPDIRRIRPDSMAIAEALPDSSSVADANRSKNPSRDIRIEQLRELQNWFNTATHKGGWRVAVVYPASALNVVSSNALLKVLEEPPAHTVFILVADAPDRLLPTLVSRCRRLPLSVPPNDASLEWLKSLGVSNASEWLAAASQAPVQALHLSKTSVSACPDWLPRLLQLIEHAGTNPDVGPLADSLDKESAYDWVDTLQRLLVDLILLRFDLSSRYYPSLPDIARVASCASPSRLSDTAKWLCQQRAVANHPLNARLFAHNVLQRVILACRASH